MTAVFLQARLDSSRLPRKALLKLGDRTVLERCFEALRLVKAERHVLLTEPDSADELQPLAVSAGWEVFVGSKEHVLERFVLASRAYGATSIIRATADNPLVSAALANQLMERILSTGADYCGFQGAPVGSGVEILSATCLESALASAPDAYEREHVSPYLYRRPDRFRIDRPFVADAVHLPSARVTLDTPEDFEYITKLWEENFRGNPPELEGLIPWLKRHPR